MQTNVLKAAVQQRNLQLLAAKIKENGGKIEYADLNSVIENLSSLAETGESFGEETKFIRLDVLRLLGTLNETGRLIFKVLPETIRWTDDNKVVNLGGYLKEVREDGTEVTVSGFSCGGAAMEEVYASEMMSDQRRMSSMLSLASARAEKAAYQNAGLGIEFKGDIFDLEASEAMKPAPQPVLPSPVSQNEKKERRKTRAKKEAEAKTEETPAQGSKEADAETTDAISTVVNVEVPAEPEEKPSVEVEVTAPVVEEQETITATDSNDSNTEMSLEDALKTTVDNGAYKGKLFSEIDEKKATWRCFVWLKKNPPAEGRDANTEKALDIVIESHPELANLL